MTIRAQLQDLEGEIVRCVAGLGYGATADDGGAVGGAEGGAKSPDEAAPFFGHISRCCIWGSFLKVYYI